MVNHPNRSKRLARLTEKEWEAVYIALEYALAGEDPWEHENPKEQDNSPTWKAVEAARDKIAVRLSRRA